MTGSVAYVREWRQLNVYNVVARHVPAEDAEGLRRLVEEHLRRTGSRRAAELLADWELALEGFRQIMPVAVVQPPVTPALEAAPSEAAAEREPAAPA